MRGATFKGVATNFSLGDRRTTLNQRELEASVVRNAPDYLPLPWLSSPYIGAFTMKVHVSIGLTIEVI